jgi:thiol-disulfide isomerase/thioredoxin
VARTRAPFVTLRQMALPLLGGLLVLLVACGGQASPTTQSQSRRDSLLPEDRLALPEYDFPRFRALLRELRGKPVVVNIWAAWCPPCRVEAPDLAEVSREFEGEVQFLGIDILDERRAARDFILEFDWPYPSVFDPEGEIRDRLGHIGQPITIVYDREGKLSFEWTGTITGDLLRAEIGKVLTG